MNLLKSLMYQSVVKGIPDSVLIGAGVAAIVWLTGNFPSLHSSSCPTNKTLGIRYCHFPGSNVPCSGVINEKTGKCEGL